MLDHYLGLGVATNSSHEPPEGDDLLVGDHVLQILGGAVQGHGFDGLGHGRVCLDLIESLA